MESSGPREMATLKKPTIYCLQTVYRNGDLIPRCAKQHQIQSPCGPTLFLPFSWLKEETILGTFC